MSAKGQSNFFDKFQRQVSPAAKRKEPAIWFSEVRILDRLSSEKEAERRRINLHRGFNILWAAPEDPNTEQGLYRDGLAGHASGKTLFCRILRHLLGEAPFGTVAQRDGITSHFLSLWAVAHIRVNGKSWVVGRPLATDGADFATATDSIDAVLGPEGARGRYDDFMNEVRKVGAPVDFLHPDQGWRHLLTWIARDQEARFSNLVAWRETASEGDNPQTRVFDRHQLMRAILGLLNEDEPKLRQRLEGDIERHDTGKVSLERRNQELTGAVVIACERAGELLGKDAPTEADELAIRVDSLAEVLRAAASQREKKPESKQVEEARRKLEAAQAALTRASDSQERLGPQIAELKQRQGTQLTLIRNLRSGNVEDPARESGGFCPKSIQTAMSRGCVAKANPSKESITTIADLEKQANADTEQIKTLEKELKLLTAKLPSLESAVEKAEEKLEVAQREDNRDLTELLRRAGRAEEVLRLFKQIDAAKDMIRKETTEHLRLAEEIERQRKAIAALREDVDSKLEVFSATFADVVRAVMGASVEAKVTITGDGVVPHVTRKGELSGAALETIKTLAFDLAAIVTSIEGRGDHPRFLIHDGPREGDMARVIYERFFLYAAGLEAAFKDTEHISFQYLVTTTTPPPKTMREGTRWLLDPVLDSRHKDRRLLKEDF